MLTWGLYRDIPKSKSESTALQKRLPPISQRLCYFTLADLAPVEMAVIKLLCLVVGCAAVYTPIGTHDYATDETLVTQDVVVGPSHDHSDGHSDGKSVEIRGALPVLLLLLLQPVSACVV